LSFCLQAKLRALAIIAKYTLKAGIFSELNNTKNKFSYLRSPFSYFFIDIIVKIF